MIDCPECVGFAKPVRQDHNRQAIFRCELCAWEGRDPLHDIRTRISAARRDAAAQEPGPGVDRWVFMLDCLDTLVKVSMSRRGKRH